MEQRWHPVNPRYIKQCHQCGVPITFKKYKGKTRLVDLYYCSGWGLVYFSGVGNHGNELSWHQCFGEKKKKKDVAGSSEVKDKGVLKKFREEIMAKYRPLLDECASDLVKYKETLDQYLRELNGDDAVNL